MSIRTAIMALLVVACLEVLAFSQAELEAITPAEDLEPPLIRQAQQDDQHLITDSEGTAVFAAPVADQQPATPVPIPNLQPARKVQWQYKVLVKGALNEEELNRMGHQGFELIAVVHSEPTTLNLVFKRQKQ